MKHESIFFLSIWFVSWYNLLMLYLCSVDAALKPWCEAICSLAKNRAKKYLEFRDDKPFGAVAIYVSANCQLGFLLCGDTES